MKSLIIGRGQIGSALYEIFAKDHECFIRDVEAVDCPEIEVLHIAYPYTDVFVRETRRYIDQYKPKLTIIHSTVAVGTTDKCGDHVVHSPERGRWPNLAFEMKKFPKFIGGFNGPDIALAESYFELCQWPTISVFNPTWTELVKLLSNIHLGLEIAWRQEVERIFTDFRASETSDFGVYDQWEETYNQGLRFLGQHHLVRPRVNPGPIGGHCILPCIDILDSQYPSDVFDFIRTSNAQVKKQTDGALTH